MQISKNSELKKKEKKRFLSNADASIEGVLWRIRTVGPYLVLMNNGGGFDPTRFLALEGL